MRFIRKLPYSLFAAMLSASLVACGGDSSDVSEGNNNDASADTANVIGGDQSGDASNSVVGDRTLGELLITRRDDTNPEIWACLGDDGLAYGYTFYDLDAVEGFNAYLGVGVVFAVESEPFRYTWTADDFSTLRLESPVTGAGDLWTQVTFFDGGRMQAQSASVGGLTCSKEDGGAA